MQQQPHHGPVQQVSSTYMTDQTAAQFCQVFAEGLDSGLNYLRILDFLARKNVSPEITQKLRHALVEEGLMLGEAFQKYGILDQSARRLILVAEEQGNLPVTFRSQMPFYTARYERKKEILFSLAEPIANAFFGLCILLPFITNIMQIFQRSAGFFDALKIGFTYTLGPMTLGMFVILGIIMVGYAWLQTPVDSTIRETILRVWLRIPGISYAGRLNAVHLFSRYLGVSIDSGMNIYDSIYLAAEASNHPYILNRINDIIHSVEQGNSLTQSFSLASGIPDEVIEAVDLGEETGRLGELLLRVAEVYKERALDSIRKAIAAFIWILRLTNIFLALGVTFYSLVNNLGGTFDEVMGSSPMVLLYAWHAHLRDKLRMPKKFKA